MRRLPSCLLALACLGGCAAAPAHLVAAPVAARTPGAPAVPVITTITPQPPAATLAAVERLAADGVEVEEAAPAASDATLQAQAMSPTALKTWQSIAQAMRSGQRTLLPGELPPYPAIDAGEKAAAVARGQGRSVPQGCISSSPTGERLSEPASLLVHASREQLLSALQSAGWVKANPRTAWSFIKMAGSVMTRLWNEQSAPVSAMYLNGKPEAFAFNKNSDYVLARDHMRVYDLGPDASGRPSWAIAATRDLAATVTFHHPAKAGEKPWRYTIQAPSFGHRADDPCDLERDLVMVSLLGAGRVRDWAVVQGQLPSHPMIQRRDDGLIQISHYVTDGLVYELSLGDAP